MQKFKSIFNNVSQKVSSTFNQLKQINLNPINIFIKDSLDKIFDDLTLGHEIKLQDIRKGSVALQNLLLNSQKINRQHLFSSPYILHNGSISRLRIQLPSLMQLQKTSITLQVEDIFLQLKPQSNFAQNFKNIIQEIKQYVRLNGADEDAEEDLMACEHDPRDYFKKLIKTMFRNLKVRVKNIVILVFLQDPQKIKSNKQRNSMLMLRIPLINVHRGGQAEIGNQTQSHKIQTVKFDIQLPQFTVHLLHEQAQKREKTFPFQQPCTNHPGTILLFGQQSFVESKIQKDENIPRAMIQIKTDYEKGEKDFNLSINAPKIKAMINPQQIKILLFFVAQMKSFGVQLEKVRKQLGLTQNGEKMDQLSVPMLLLSRKSSNKRMSQDLFGSVCMSFWESGTFMVPQSHHRSKRRSPDMIDSVIDKHPQLKAEVQQLNRQLEQSLYHSINQEKQQEVFEQKHIMAITFKNFVTFNLKLGIIQIYIVKHLGSQHQKRSWGQKTTSYLVQQINTEMKQSYFLFSLMRANFKLNQRDKQIQLELQELLMRHVKYLGKNKGNECKQNKSGIKNRQKLSQSRSQDLQFFDVQNSMDYYLQQQGLEQSQKKEQQENGHHCAQNVVRISHKSCQQYNQHHKNTHKMQSFCPNIVKKSQSKQQQVHTYQPGVLLRKKQTEKESKLTVKMMYIEVSIGTQLGLEIVQFCSLVKQILDTQNQTKPNNHNINQSTNKNENQQKNNKNQQNQHQQNTHHQQQKHPKQEQTKTPSVKTLPTSFQITTYSIQVTFYQSLIDNFKSSVQRYQQQIHDCQSTCFCSLNTQGVYLAINQLRLQIQPQTIKMALKTLNLGLINIDQSNSITTHPLIQIKQYHDIQNNKKQKLKLLYQTNKKHKPKAQRVILTLPQIQMDILENNFIESLSIIKRQTQIFFPKIQKIIVKKTVNDNKKQISDKKVNKKDQTASNDDIDIQFSVIRMRFLDLELYFRNLSVQKKTDQLFMHLSTIVLSSTVLNKTFQTKMKKSGIPQYSQVKQKHQDNKNSRYSLINDFSILFQMNNSEYCPKKVQKSHRNIKKRSQKSGSFISDQIVLERQSCLILKIKTEAILNTEQTKQIISISLSSPLCINAINSLKAYHKLQEYETFIDKVNNMINDITIKIDLTNNPGQKNQQQQSGQIIKQSNLYCQQVQVSGGKLFIDIQPTFLQNLPKNKTKNNQKQKQSNHLILSNTRSIFQLQWDDLKVDNFSKNSQRYSSATLNFKYYFTKLTSESKDSQQNFHKTIGCLIQSNENIFENNHFNKIIEVKKIKVNIQKISHLIRPNITIDEIKIQSSFQNLSWLILHWQHLTKHDLNKDYGMTIDQSQNIVQELKWDENQQNNSQQGQLQIEDLTNAEYMYNQKIIYKKQIQQRFIKKKSFTQPQIDSKCQLFLQNLSIQQISIKLPYNKISHLETYLQGVKIVSKIHQQSKIVQMLFKLQQFQVNLFQKHQQPQGLFGMVVNFWYKTQDETFQILKTNKTMKLLLQIDQKNIMIKTDKVSLEIGFTSQLLKAIDEWDKIDSEIKDSGWKKIYNEEIKQKDQKTQRLLLINGPQTSLSLTLVYEGLNILSSKRLQTPLFILHQETQRQDKIKSYVLNWVESLIRDNIKGLIAVGALESFSSLVKQLLRLVKVVVSMFLRCFG